MKMATKVIVGVGVFAALLVPGISAMAQEGTTPPAPSTAPASAGESLPGDVGDPLLGTVSNAEKGAVGVPEVAVPERQATLAEARTKFNPKNSPDTTVVLNPDGTFTITMNNPAPANARHVETPVGGFDDPEKQRLAVEKQRIADGGK